MTPEQEAKLDRAITLSEQILDSAGVRYPDGPTLQKSLVKSVDTDENPATPKVPLEHLNVLSDALDAKFAEVEKRLIRIEEQTAPPT
jgi:hypothetical protein